MIFQISNFAIFCLVCCFDEFGMLVVCCVFVGFLLLLYALGWGFWLVCCVGVVGLPGHLIYHVGVDGGTAVSSPTLALAE